MGTRELLLVDSGRDTSRVNQLARPTRSSGKGWTVSVSARHELESQSVGRLSTRPTRPGHIAKRKVLASGNEGHSVAPPLPTQPLRQTKKKGLVVARKNIRTKSSGQKDDEKRSIR